MIIEYDSIYDEQIKELFIELQEYIAIIDEENYNIITNEYKEKYFVKTMDEISKYNGKMFLMKENDNIIGLVVGIVNNEEINTYDFKVPKRGRITELIVTKNCRTNGSGTKLLNSMEMYLKEIGCKDILIDVFGYNDNAINFYNKKGYKTRMIEMTKVNI